MKPRGWCCGRWACRWMRSRRRPRKTLSADEAGQGRGAGRPPHRDACYLPPTSPARPGCRTCPSTSTSAASCRAPSSPNCWSMARAEGTLDAWLSDRDPPRARPVHRQRQPGGDRRDGLPRDHAWTRPTSPRTQLARWRASTWIKHKLGDRITGVHLGSVRRRLRGPYDLILCNPPYVNSPQHVRPCRAEYRARAGIGAGRRRGRHGSRAPASSHDAPHAA